MPLYHCNNCHHEWEGMRTPTPICDWCKSEGHVIEETTPLELSIKDMMKKEET